MKWSRKRADGQALVLVALSLGLLIMLVVGVNEVALRRRIQSRVQDSLDQAAAAAVTQVAPVSLVNDSPALLPPDVERRFRTVLRAELLRVSATIEPDPATLAQQARLTILAPGGSCYGRAVSAPAICADLAVTLTGVFGRPQIRFTTLAQAARHP